MSSLEFLAALFILYPLLQHLSKFPPPHLPLPCSALTLPLSSSALQPLTGCSISSSPPDFPLCCFHSVFQLWGLRQMTDGSNLCQWVRYCLCIRNISVVQKSMLFSQRVCTFHSQVNTHLTGTREYCSLQLFIRIIKYSIRIVLEWNGNARKLLEPLWCFSNHLMVAGHSGHEVGLASCAQASVVGSLLYSNFGSR